MKATVEEYITENFYGHLQVYTDGFIQIQNRSKTAVFQIPALNLNWYGKLVHSMFSSTAEVTAITEALEAVLQLPI